MKESFLILLIGLCSSIYSQNIEGVFTIKKIDSTLNYYLIRAYKENNDSVLIISKKITCYDTTKNVVLSLGSEYYFHLVPYLEMDKMTAMPKEQFSLRLDNCIVWSNEKYFPFKTDNLVGLCYKGNKSKY